MYTKVVCVTVIFMIMMANYYADAGEVYCSDEQKIQQTICGLHRDTKRVFYSDCERLQYNSDFDKSFHVVDAEKCDPEYGGNTKGKQ